MTLAKVKGGKIVEKFFLASFILFLVFISYGCSPKPGHIAPNEFGLIIIRRENTYKKITAADTSKKMVLLDDFIAPLPKEWFYATSNNFTHQILYRHPAAYMRLPAALALQKVAVVLKKIGLGIKIFDAYRPYSITKKMWKIVPDDNYAADPAKGSGHNRGIAVDLTLINLQTGKELPMPTPFDNFSDSAHHNFMQLSKEVLQNRALLKNTMEQCGFIALPTEWWHYSLPDPKTYDLLDLDFKAMRHVAN